ncbi:MAG: 1-acyl-sn-glycerol-3-phosphate acyltransferase [Marinobacter sp.]|nr:1-acyl-sn-glycerol-3-phosphate acyltransferase [Marinobacter sp.]
MHSFDDIRPYNDDEVGPVIGRLLGDESFLQLITQFSATGAGMTTAQVSQWLSSEFGTLSTVRALQEKIYPLVDNLVQRTAQVTATGLDTLAPSGSYLFICNHRDIVFDPMSVNYLLHRQGLDTTRIAIGDNLLQNRLFGELMRLNKSFVVKRNISSPREMRDVFLNLSAFIHHSVREEGQSVWLAQREGRAKDGRDETDPAIIKMLYMSRKRNGESFAEALAGLKIVPVSIAYEYDPCDQDKARELAIRADTGSYQKQPGDDTQQIIRGLTGSKGRVHLYFGKPLGNDLPDTPKALAEAIDREMHAHYHLFPSNLVAWARQTGKSLTPEMLADHTQEELTQAEQVLDQRLAQCTAAQQPFLLASYANPVDNWLKARGL